MATDSKMSLKLLIDMTKNKVVFAEAGKDFVDFLLNMLSLPMSTVIRLLTKSTMVGCVANLYESLENLNETYMQPNQNKDSLLKPKVQTQVTNPNFLLPDTQREPGKQKLYYCQSHTEFVSDSLNSMCSLCRSQGYGTRYMNQEVKFVDANNSTGEAKPSDHEGGYVKGTVTYMVTDDMCVSPMSMVSGVCLLNKSNVKDFGVLKEREIEFGIDEGINLLKASLLSKNALTDVFLQKQVVRN